MEQIIINAITNAIPHTVVRCFETTGGWVIEAINPVFNNPAVAEQSVAQALHRWLLQNQPVVIIWKIFVYTNADERFSVSGTLHVRESEYDNDGIQTTFLEADDCYVNLSEFDAEILQLGDYNGRQLNVFEAMSDDGIHPLLQYNQVAYIWLETLGGSYYLEPQDPTVLLNGAQHPALIQVNLQR